MLASRRLAGPPPHDDPTTVDPAAVTHAPTSTTGPVTLAPAAIGPRLRADEALTIATDFEQRYELGGELARGGLARIRDAYDRVLHRRVAVKQLLARGGDADVRFLREARRISWSFIPEIAPPGSTSGRKVGSTLSTVLWRRGMTSISCWAEAGAATSRAQSSRANNVAERGRKNQAGKKRGMGGRR